jgi:hypothetical protein
MNDFISSITDPRLQDSLFTIKIVFIVAGLIFSGFVVWALFKTNWKYFKFLYDVHEFLAYRAYGYGRVTRDWERIKQRLQTPNEAEYKLAIMEADDMLASLLLRIGFAQPTLAERLKNVTPAIIPNLEEVTRAHAMRNNIVHDPDYHLSLEQARKTLDVYEDAFRALDLI